MFSFGMTRLPSSNPELIKDLQLAGQRLLEKLEQLNIDDLDITEYNKRYLKMMIGVHDGLINTLRKYAFVLAWSLHNKKDYKNLIFLDYGAGHGLLSMMAKELGIKNCLLSDIFPPSMDDAKVLADALNLEFSHLIVGDTNETIKFLKDHNIDVDVIANYDTIEHIYDIDEFIEKLSQFGVNPSYFFASGANGLNPFIEKDLRKTHIKFEIEDKKVSKGHKDSDSVTAYTKIREEIIRKHLLPKVLEDKEITELVRVTRGKRQDDIIQIVDHYLNTKQLPPEIPEKTDTCDPMNGNWAEHIMNPFELNQKIEKYGFSNNKVLAGFYGKPKKPLKKIIGFFFNLFIKLMPTKIGLKLAPYYAIYGEKK